jgi:hypothetical protein
VLSDKTDKRNWRTMYKFLEQQIFVKYVHLEMEACNLHAIGILVNTSIYMLHSSDFQEQLISKCHFIKISRVCNKSYL